MTDSSPAAAPENIDVNVEESAPVAPAAEATAPATEVAAPAAEAPAADVAADAARARRTMDHLRQRVPSASESGLP